VGEVFLKAAAEGKKDVCQDYLKYCQAVGCRAPAERIGAAVKTLRELAPGKCVYAWIETGPPQPAMGATTKSTAAKSDPAQPVAAAPAIRPADIRAAVRAALAAGATGIGYRGFEGLDLKVKPAPEVLAELKRINESVAAHAAELLADPAKAEALLK
jgi:hypothetical protein